MMRKCLGVAVGIVMVLISVGTSVAAESQPPDVMTIIVHMKHVFEPSSPTIRKTVITTTDNMGRTYEMTAGRAWKDFPEGKRELMVILEPKSARGIAFVTSERTKGKQETDYFEYIPYIRRVRKLVGLESYSRFLNTEFTYSDLGFIPVDQKYTLLGVEERNGVRTYKIEETVPKEQQQLYSRLLVWVAVDTGLPVERNYYDMAGRLWKTELFKEVLVFDGVPVRTCERISFAIGNSFICSGYSGQSL